MNSLYGEDLAHVHASAFGDLARGSAAEIVRRLRNAGIAIRRVIDVGCGAGPLTKALIDAGFEVTGIDASTELLELARKNAPGARFIHGSVYDIELPACEAVIALGEPLTYHSRPEVADNLVRDFYRQVAEVLPPGGVLIFDVIGLGEPSLTGRSWRSGEDWAVLVETTENQSERTLLRNIETFRRAGELYRCNKEVHNVRLFDIQELRNQLASFGFATETAQSYGAQPLGPRRHAIFARRLGKLTLGRRTKL